MSESNLNTKDVGGGDIEISDPLKLPASPMVSVWMITYNHASYIRAALDSVCTQQVSFPYEICLGEDGSDDGTREICLEYLHKYPDKIRIFLRNRGNSARSQYRIPHRHNTVQTLAACRGKYVALLEGDDYWIDPQKLQIQADYLSAKRTCAACFGMIEAIRDEAVTPFGWGSDAQINADLKDILRNNLVPTCTAMVRREAIEDLLALKVPLRNVAFGDWPIMIMAAQRGTLDNLQRVLAHYRIHPGGIWSQTSESAAANNRIGIYEHMRPHIPRSALPILRQCLATCYLKSAYIEEKKGKKQESIRQALRALWNSRMMRPRILRESLLLIARVAAPAMYFAIQHVKRASSGRTM